MRLNSIVFDFVSTNCLKLLRYSSDDIVYSLSDQIIGRLCSEILLEIYSKVKWLSLESLSMEGVFRSINYPNLYQFGLYHIDEESFKRSFIGKINSINDIFLS
ncbi:unnamed protein product [Rotaria sp. Silwood2]|nr:unnamed protein product [Rotaria sp. Silwood2]CAF3020683.1 unnamed protein product [Rotaria sp. Silwood2]CAF3345108.1 unnamed protein product [Rotaria sp. Silwood2]CAF3396541.1 unnamed protein product [Rotaria sp. Silwood2]CAF4142264.1 unnamed protein product [Rotaria sp. Silwood2]